MDYLRVTTEDALRTLCEQLATADRIGFDTEFVSEDTFRPELCLVQVVWPTGLAIIDPQLVPRLDPFWRVLAEGQHRTVVHAAREELNFSLTAIDAPPARLFDTQIAAAFCGDEFPAAYSSVVTRLLGIRPAKGEQRTDWRRRPLTEDQIQYALEDVRHLLPLHDVLQAAIDQFERQSWFDEEMELFCTEVIASRTRQRWRKVTGIGNLAPRSLAIVRELWLWRQAEAERRDLPPRRILRDDLLVELAKRKTAKSDKIKALRGMNFRPLKSSIDDIAACVERGLAAPIEEFEPTGGQSMPPQLNLLGQFLVPALTSICRSAHVAASMAGTATDVRDLIAYQLGYSGPDAAPPALARGWRADFIGNLIDELLAGEKSIRIANPKSEHPLEFIGSDGELLRPMPSQKRPRATRARRPRRPQ